MSESENQAIIYFAHKSLKQGLKLIARDEFRHLPETGIPEKVQWQSKTFSSYKITPPPNCFGEFKKKRKTNH